jgi:hypothetical protein
MAKKSEKPDPPKILPPSFPLDSHDVDPENIGEHEGATEEQVAPTTPPAGPEFDDEPKQG